MDWRNGPNSPFRLIGASNHSDYERVEHDFYSTDPKAINYLLKYEKFDNKIYGRLLTLEEYELERELNGLECKCGGK